MLFARTAKEKDGKLLEFRDCYCVTLTVLFDVERIARRYQFSLMLRYAI